MLKLSKMSPFKRLSLLIRGKDRGSSFLIKLRRRLLDSLSYDKVATLSEFIPIGEWDSLDCGFDIEATQGLPEDKRKEIDFTVDGIFEIPLQIQLYWYEWILYQLEDCIDNFRHANADLLYGRFAPPPKGSVGPLELLRALTARADNGDLSKLGCCSNSDIFYKALEFRHLAEHRNELMDIRMLNAAVDLPHRLNDHVRAERFDLAYNVLTSTFKRDKATDCTTSTASSAVSDEAAFNEVYNMIIQPPTFAHSPLQGLLYYLIDSLKLASFSWAQSTHPEYFTLESHYKAYEPKFWAHTYPHTGHGSQCEGAKTAFLDNDPMGNLLKKSFEGAVEIRNFFTHRTPPMEQEEINDCSRTSRFWHMKRSAVMLALMLGEVDLALEFDARIRAFLSGRETENVADEARIDGVEDLVKDLMSGSDDRRDAVLSGELFCGEETFRKDMRQKWVCLDLLVEGEEQIRVAIEPAKAMLQNPSPETEDRVTEEPQTGIIRKDSLDDEKASSSDSKISSWEQTWETPGNFPWSSEETNQWEISVELKQSHSVEDAATEYIAAIDKINNEDDDHYEDYENGDDTVQSSAVCGAVLEQRLGKLWKRLFRKTKVCAINDYNSILLEWGN